jgi:hypothetical protein
MCPTRRALATVRNRIADRRAATAARVHADLTPGAGAAPAEVRTAASTLAAESTASAVGMPAGPSATTSPRNLWKRLSPPNPVMRRGGRSQERRIKAGVRPLRNETAA